MSKERLSHLKPNQDGEFISGSPSETLHLGEHLGRWAYQGAVLALTGDLGTGKTLLTKGIAKGIGIPNYQHVNSPSFTMLNIYKGPLTLYHFDWYRLEEPEDIWSLGFEEILESQGVVVIEWAERAPEAWLYLSGWTVYLSYTADDDEKRLILIEKR